MDRLNVSIRVIAAALVCGAFAGCPGSGGGGGNLVVSPAAINFGSVATAENISIYNSGTGAIAWTLSENISWLTANVTSGTVTTETDHVKLKVDRTGLNPGTYNGTVTVSSGSGNRNVAVSVTVPGAADIEVSPATLNLLNQQETATFTISNVGNGVLTWTIQLYDSDDVGTQISVPSFMQLSPMSGNTTAGGTSEVTIQIDRDLIQEQGVLGYVIVVNSNAGQAQVALNITAGISAEIGVEPTVLDFGTSLNVLTFDVFNSGFPGSALDFTLSTNRPDLIFFDPPSGTSIGTNNPLNPDRVPITVTIDRNALTGETDGGRITVSASGLDSKDVVINVTASPLVFEGAQNRSRPPFILRFVFLLRDALGNAIDTTNPAVFDELQGAFTVREDGTLLDTDETNLFVTNAENLRYNIVLMLDYTGSMFNSGGGNGSVIEQMVNASMDFIDDLPPSYRLALMEYHERQQTNRLIHNFSTSKDSLKAALQAFQVPFGEHGASEVNDAIIDACLRLADEDIGTLSFDDADVRALVFISDGRDTSSVNATEDVITTANDNRVRLYPIGFGNNVNAPPLIRMATETGGHYYPASTPAALVSLLQSQSGTGADPGLIVTELQRQIVLTYISLFQEGQHNYLISAEYQGLEGSFQKDGVFAIGGDIRAGQIGLRTAGIQSDGTAELFVRTEYVPRNVSQFRVRFISPVPITVQLDPNGLIKDWFLVDDGGGVFTALTSETTPLRYGAFGNLFRVRFTGLNLGDVIPLGFRVDNQIYVNPPFTKFFQYPDGITLSAESAQESVVPILLSDGFDPDASNAFDRDEDGTPDFDDPFPDNPNLP